MEIQYGFGASAYACSTYRAMLEELRALEAGLHSHTPLENNILFPHAIPLEGRTSGHN